MKATNHGPMFDCANACTELTTPLRVRKVPRMHIRNVQNTSHTFHTFIIPRFSCIITECKKAVPVSHGSSDAFSTGSQPQYPPQPSTAYAQCAPSMIPSDWNIHAIMVHLRVRWIHFSPGYRASSAPRANANGIVNPV